MSEHDYDVRCVKCKTNPPDSEAEFIAFWDLQCSAGGVHEMPDVIMSPAERKSVEEYEAMRRPDGSHPWEDAYDDD